VAAASSKDAWAVGDIYTTTSRTFVLHWNGVVWKRQKTPNGSSGVNILWGVAATSGTNAWAVGSQAEGSGQQTLVLRWNGSRWKIQPSPDPDPTHDSLYAVAADSASDAWAVGSYDAPTPQALAIRCC
jgi:hypothetical protein